MTAVTEKYQLDIPAPELIKSDAQHKEYISTLSELERRPRLTADERKYANLLALLIEKFESEHYPVGKLSPLEVLRFLIEENDLRQKDLAPLLRLGKHRFGSSQRQTGVDQAAH